MSSSGRFSRREALAMLGAAGASAVAGHTRTIGTQTPPSTLGAAVRRNDAAVRGLLSSQITDGAS